MAPATTQRNTIGNDKQMEASQFLHSYIKNPRRVHTINYFFSSVTSTVSAATKIFHTNVRSVYHNVYQYAELKKWTSTFNMKQPTAPMTLPNYDDPQVNKQHRALVSTA